MAEKLLVILWAFATAWLVARVSSLVARRVLLWNDERHWAGGADLADQMANIKRRETLVSVFRGAVASGTSHTVRVPGTATVATPNAGALLARVDGRATGLLGEPGEAVVTTLGG